jgi:hypothetical protein
MDKIVDLGNSVADPDLGSCAFFTPKSGTRGSGMETIQIRDLGWKKFRSGIRVGKHSDPGCGMEKSRIWIRNTDWKKITLSNNSYCTNRTLLLEE